MSLSPWYQALTPSSPIAPITQLSNISYDSAKLIPFTKSSGT